jgi:hypothetical protein
VGVGGSSALCGLSGARGATERVWRSTFCMVHHHPSLEQLRPLPPLTDTWTNLEGWGGSKVELTIPTQRLFLAHPVPASLARHTISPSPPPRRRALPFGNAAPARRSLAARLPQGCRRRRALFVAQGPRHDPRASPFFPAKASEELGNGRMLPPVSALPASLLCTGRAWPVLPSGRLAA